MVCIRWTAISSCGRQCRHAVPGQARRRAHCSGAVQRITPKSANKTVSNYSPRRIPAGRKIGKKSSGGWITSLFPADLPRLAGNAFREPNAIRDEESSYAQRNRLLRNPEVLKASGRRVHWLSARLSPTFCVRRCGRTLDRKGLGMSARGPPRDFLSATTRESCTGSAPRGPDSIGLKRRGMPCVDGTEMSACLPSVDTRVST